MNANSVSGQVAQASRYLEYRKSLPGRVCYSCLKATTSQFRDGLADAD